MNITNQLTSLPPAVSINGNDLMYLFQDGKLKRLTIDVLAKSNSFSGWSGWSGISGWSGTSGYSGLDGKYAASGYSGWSGISGYSGSNSLTVIKEKQIGIGGKENNIVGSDNFYFEQGKESSTVSLQGHHHEKSLQFSYDKKSSSVVFNTNPYTATSIASDGDNVGIYVKNTQIPNGELQSVLKIVNGNHGKEFGYVEMNGKLNICASNNVKAMLNMPVGVVPEMTKDGDMWRTVDGIFMNDAGTIKKLSFTSV